MHISLYIPRASMSITRRSLVLNSSIHLSMISRGILFHSSIMASFKESIWLILHPCYTFCSKILRVLRSPNLLDSNLEIIFGDQWWGSRNLGLLSFNISRVSLTVWVLASFCMNKYSLCFASLFNSGIIFFNSKLQKYFAFTFVFNSTSFHYSHRNYYLLGKSFNFANNFSSGTSTFFIFFRV